MLMKVKCHVSSNASTSASGRWVTVANLWATTPVSNADCGGDNEEQK